MRCPKCGFISFDHVDSCLKCNKSISGTSSQLEGTTYNVAPPSFLKFSKNASLQREEEDDIGIDMSEVDDNVIDPDLDVLVDEEAPEREEDAEISFGDEFEGFDNLSEEEEFEISEEDESEDEDIDLGQFEDAFGDEESAPEEELSMEMPEELADISDLQGPDQEPAEEELQTVPAVPADEVDGSDDDFNLDLDLDDLDNEEFKLTDDEEGDNKDDSVGELSLDDLGLSESEEQDERAKSNTSKKKSSDDSMDMDADLDFDLDLGGITLDDDDEEKEK